MSLSSVRIPRGHVPRTMLAWGAWAGLTFALLGVARGQAPTAAPAASEKPAAAPAATATATVIPPDDRPLARYVPGENLAFLFEHDGLDNHAEAWGKTAASKMLSETKLGAMLEAMTEQLADRWLANLPNRKVGGADVLTIIKHAARRGVVLGGGLAPGGDGKTPRDHTVVVFRGATAKDVRPAFSRLVGTMMGASKPQLGKKGARTVVVVPSAEKGGRSWVWYSEGNDLVIESGEEALAGDVIDGKVKSAIDHPIRHALASGEGTFQPFGRVFFDIKGMPGAGLPGSPIATLKGAGIDQLEWRFGADNEALASIVKLVAPKPRKGLMAFFDQPTFDTSKLPPLPEGLGSFVAVSIDADKAVDALLATLPPGAGKEAVDQQVDAVKSKTRVDLKKDVLARIGPKMVAYIMPGGPAARPGGEEGAGLAGLVGGAPLSPASLAALSSLPVPRITLVAEVDNAEAFGKTLDTLMIAVNQQLRAQAAAAAEAAEAAAGANEPNGGQPGAAGEPGREGRPRGGRGAAGGTRSRGSAATTPAPEFKLMPGKEKSYVLVVPSALSKSFPAGLRPAVRLGAKHVVIATTADAARLALEAKAGAWTPPSEISAAYDALPKNLMYLAVSDPRSIAPEVLASFPATLQRAVNTAMVSANTRPAAGGNAAGGAAAGPGAPGMPGFVGADVGGGAPGGRKGNVIAGAPAGAYPGGSGAPAGAYPGGSGAPAGAYPGGSGGAPGAGGAQSGGEGQGDASPGLLTFNIDASKMPKAEELRSRMFPGTTSITADDTGVTLVHRESFPNVVGLTALLTGAMAQQARVAAARPPTTPGAEGGAAPASGAPAGGLQPSVPGGGGGSGLRPAVPGGGGATSGSPPTGGNAPASPG